MKPCTSTPGAFECPCHPDPDSGARIPTFIGDDYFCESGIEDGTNLGERLANMPYFLEDPLWDGRQCLDDCCRGSPFVKTLDNGPTTDPLEIRICNISDQLVTGGNILVEEVNIYVQ